LERQIDEQKKTAAAGHPVVLAILDKFDGAEISAVQPHKAENEMQSNEGVKNA
jgi:hypothetical protein